MIEVPEDPDRLLSTDDVSGRLGVQPETVRLWARRGRLPSVHLGARRLRFRESDIDLIVQHGLDAVEFARQSRAAQGLDEHVSDPDVLARVAGLVKGVAPDAAAG